MKHLLLLIIFFLPLSLLSQLPDTNYDEALVPKYTLPDLFELDNGGKVADRNGWLLRRKEIIAHFENEVYGVSPEWNGSIESFVISETDTLFEGLAERQEILVRLRNNDRTVDISLLLYRPKNILKAPLFLGYNFHGNHTVTVEKEVRITGNWVRNNNTADAVNNKASEKGRGVFTDQWPIREIISRGFGVATLYYGDIDPDYDDGFKNGVHQLYENERDGSSWGSIAAWAWGLSRVMDYLETKDGIDHDRIFLIGHSRLGKAALWAAATDERFAMVISNNSGCGGAALSRRQFGETVEIINNSFPHWFNANFKQYNGKENLLPVDQHALIALMAPRPVYIASASEDLWADPKGEFLAGVHASPVYNLFCKKGIGASSMPPVNTPVHQGSIGYHLRDGKHDITLYDWQQYMDYSAHFFSDDLNGGGKKNPQKAIFLHHSTGNGVWKGGVPEWIADYNATHHTNIQATEFSYPNKPYPWANYPYDFWNLWVNNNCDSDNKNIECLSTLVEEYDLIIIKHCFPGAAIKADTGTPDIASQTRTLENYKLQYRALRDLFDRYPDTKFMVWTLAPLHRLATDAGDAARAREFVEWVKREWLSEDAKSHPNISIFDFFALAAESNPSPINGQVNCLKYEYELKHDNHDSHPNTTANTAIAPYFAKAIVDVLAGSCQK